jgi:hypothetical protein
MSFLACSPRIIQRLQSAHQIRIFLITKYIRRGSSTTISFLWSRTWTSIVTMLRITHNRLWLKTENPSIWSIISQVSADHKRNATSAFLLMKALTYSGSYCWHLPSIQFMWKRRGVSGVFCDCFLLPRSSTFHGFPATYVLQLHTHQVPQRFTPRRRAGFCPYIYGSCWSSFGNSIIVTWMLHALALGPEIRCKNCIHYLRTNVSNFFFHIQRGLASSIANLSIRDHRSRF